MEGGSRGRSLAGRVGRVDRRKGGGRDRRNNSSGNGSGDTGWGDSRDDRGTVGRGD